MLSFFLAWRNLVRNRERSLLTLLGVLLAIGSFVALVSLAEGLGHKIEQELDSRAVDLYILPSQGLTLPGGPMGTMGVSHETISDKWVKSLPQLSDNIARAEGIRRESWVGKHTVLPVLYLEQEAISSFFPHLSGLPEEFSAQEILLGEKLAQQELDPQAPEPIRHAQSSFEVAGILQGQGFQAYYAFVQPRSSAHSEGYQEVWVRLRDAELALGDANKILPSLPEGLEVLTRQQYLNKCYSFLRYSWLFQASIASIGVLVAVTAAMNTMLMSTYERLREFAVLRAIGASRATVAAMLVWESLMLSLLGGLLGCLFGTLLAQVLDGAVVVLLNLPFPLGQVTLKLLLEALALAVLVGLAGAAIPLVLIYRQKLMDGLRSE